MCAFLYPDEYLDSTYSIDFDQLYKEGYRGIIFDIDNTLVPHGAPADERAISLFTHLKELGFHCMLLSNNKEPRVKILKDAMQELLSIDFMLQENARIQVFMVQCTSIIFTRQGNPNRQGIARQWRYWARTHQILFLWEIRFLRMCVGQIWQESGQFL